MFGDAVLASLYEIPDKDFARGVSVEVILARIAPRDRETVAANIHRAIVSGESSAAQYTVICPSGTRRSLFAIGRCFVDGDGVPSYYSGMVTTASNAPLLQSDSIEGHCQAALAIAKEQGRELTERYLSSALRSLGQPGTSS